MAPGREQYPSLSPDGNLVAYVSDESGTDEVWIMDVRGGTPLPVTRGQEVDGRPAWFPDGRNIAFTGQQGGRPAIYTVPKLGGPPVLLVPDAAYPAIAPDGTRIAFSRRDASEYLRIAVAPLADLSRARILTHENGGIFRQVNPAWSPDGTTLCYEDFKDVWTVPSAGGSAHPLTTDHAASGECAWSPDGERIYHSSRRQGTAALWWVPARGGEPVRLTMGVGPEVQPSVALDGARLAHSTAVDQPEIVLFDTRTGGQVRLPGFRGDGSPAFAPDGRSLVWASSRQGKDDLWLQTLLGDHPSGPPRPLTDDSGEGVSAPEFSRDGRWVAYYRVLEGHRDIWVVPAEGGPPARITEDRSTDVHPSWSPDGESIVFSSDRDGHAHLWIQPISGGRPRGSARRLTSGATFDFFPAWSPDGRRIAFVGQMPAESEPAESEVWVVDAAGLSPPRRVTLRAGAECVRWLPSGRDLLVSGRWDGGRMEARRVALSDGRSAPLEPGFSFGGASAVGEFSVTSDGRFLAFVRIEAKGDLWVLEAPPGNY
jgi:Tol biopolymer transport system component